MPSRGLPGFLRRSRRRDDFDDDASADGTGEDGGWQDSPGEGGDVEDGNADGGDRNGRTSAASAAESSSSSEGLPPASSADPSPPPVAAAEGGATAAGATGWPWSREARRGGDGGDGGTGSSHNNGNDGSLSEKDSVSTLGDSDPVMAGASAPPLDPRQGATPARTDAAAAAAASERKRFSYRESQFERILAEPVVKVADLRSVAWNGIPPQLRGTTWKILLGYLPTNSTRRRQTLERKRAEYKEAIRQHYDIDDNSRTLQEQETLRQVLVDVPRTAPEIPLFRNEKIKRALARLLYIWAMRHPASSYVQGINDLATPLFAVFLADLYDGEDVLDGSVMVVLAEDRVEEVEADVYWCLTNILAGIQDHYTADQPGVQRMVMRLQELVNRIDGDLSDHIQLVGIQFMQFAFKWMNCLLLREFNMKCVIRLWDTYISEEGGHGFEDFHVYVCAAFLCQFSSQLQGMDFDELFQFMQQVPTEDWGETEIEMLLSQAYVLSTLFGGSDAHLNSSNRVPPAPVM